MEAELESIDPGTICVTYMTCIFDFLFAELEDFEKPEISVATVRDLIQRGGCVPRGVINGICR